MSAQVNVVVRSGPVTVEQLGRRPVRLTPDGVAGVVYGGLVYPLHAGDFINLDDATFDKYECSIFVDNDVEVPYAPIDRVAGPPTAELNVPKWAVEHNRFGNYLVFDADEDTAQAVADLMVDIGLGVRRWDASVRRADDGYFYNWFIRLDFDGSREATIDRITNAFAARVSFASGDAELLTLAELGQLRAQVADLEHARDVAAATIKTISEASRTLAETATQLASELGATEAALEEERKTARSWKRRLIKEQQKRRAFEAQIEDSQRFAAADASSGGAFDAEVRRATEAALAVAKADRDTAEKLMAEADAESTALRTKLAQKETALRESGVQAEALRGQMTQMQDEIVELRTAEVERATARRVSRHREGGPVGLERFLERALPRLRLHPGGLDELVDLREPTGMLRTLLDIEQQRPLRRTACKGLSSPLQVWEVSDHIHIGDYGGGSSLGRVYWAARDGVVLVRVHRKHDSKEQDREIRNFATWCDAWRPELDRA